MRKHRLYVCGLRFHIWEYEDRVWGAGQTCSKQAEARILREITRKLFPENPLMAGYAAWDVSITAEGNDIYEKI